MVVPSSPDGLHCGIALIPDPATVSVVVPSSPDGLHCGNARVDAVGWVARSSRPLRTGSIAALSPSTRYSPRLKSSRPLRTGSIAACAGAWPCAGTSSRRPVLSGRAPLRRRPGRAGRRGRRSRPVLSGRAPLRLLSRGRRRGGRRVVPSSPDGLHCGIRADAVGASVAEVVPSSPDGLHCGPLPVVPRDCGERVSSRPLRTGSIAAGIGSQAPLHMWGRPVLSGRAPLRLLGRPGADDRPGWSSRPLRTGSIAAPSTPSHWTRSTRSSRPLRTGSIAAGVGTVDRHRVLLRRPVLSGRAPLRPPCTHGRWMANCWSSRPLRTGSIAATSWWCDGCSSWCRPVLSGRAPLRRRPAVADVRRRRVVPSSPDGLHCGGLAEEGPAATATSSRPLRTGSIAARPTPTPGTFSTSRPVLSGRAPLRLRRRRPATPCSPRSSRPLRTGSIAATPG